MIANYDELLNKVSCVEQGSLDWHRARLGYITSSNVSKLMTTSRDKDKKFGATSVAYLYEVAAGRNLVQSVVDDDERFANYLYRVDISTNKAVRYGTETEGEARMAYFLGFAKKDGNEVDEVGFIPNKEIEMYGDSPDGVVVDGATGKPVGALEIKCPKPETYLKYRTEIFDNESLKKVKPEYYWQCQSHIENLGVNWCDFVAFDKDQKGGIHVVRITRNDDDINTLRQRVIDANEYIETEILKTKKQ